MSWKAHPSQGTLKPVPESPCCQGPVSSLDLSCGPPVNLDSAERQAAGLGSADSRDEAAVACPVEAVGGQGVLPQSVQSLEHPSPEVAAHEGPG